MGPGETLPAFPLFLNLRVSIRLRSSFLLDSSKFSVSLELLFIISLTIVGIVEFKAI